MIDRFRSFVRFCGAAELSSIAILLLAFTIPLLSSSPFVVSLAMQILIAIPASFSVYVMLRMDLMTFAVPAFMAMGAYSAAIAALRGGLTDTLLLTALSFAVPALVALPLGALVLRLRGVYFVLVTFLLAQITVLALFETPTLTGGSNGLSDMPATTLFGTALEDNRAVLFLAAGLALFAGVITTALTRYYRQHFAAIKENQVLAESLGLVVWHYKMLGFIVAAGLSGMAGFSLLNMLLTAHPSSFGAMSSVDYIAYAIVGGAGSMLGPIVGSTLLITATNLFSTRGEYSTGLFGLLIIIVVLAMKDGIVGSAIALAQRLRARQGNFAITAKQMPLQEIPTAEPAPAQEQTLEG
jgi:ABC-type branched-subunit amino acid transport system permease subunit